MKVKSYDIQAEYPQRRSAFARRCAIRHIATGVLQMMMADGGRLAEEERQEGTICRIPMKENWRRKN